MTKKRTTTPFLHLFLPFALVAAVGLAGCDSGEPEPEVIKPISSAQPSADSPAARPGGGGAPSTAGAGQLDFQLPESWVEEPPANSMRLLQARLPGDDGDGEFAVFYFGPGGGGGVEANIERWLGQVDPAQGTEPIRETFESGGLTIHTVEAKGALTPSRMTMNAPEPEPQEGYMLLGAVVEGPGGPWFLKLTGPETTVAPEREAFMEMVRNLA